MQNEQDSESESEKKFENSPIMRRNLQNESDPPTITTIEIPHAVQEILARIEQAQLLRAREDINSQMNDIMNNVHRIMARYTLDFNLQSERNMFLKEHMKKQRSIFLDKMATYAKNAEMREKTLAYILAWLEEWNAILSDITATDIEEHYHWIVQMELFPDTLRAIENNVNILCRISTSFLEEKKKHKKKILSRGALWKTWKERAIKRPATTHALRPDQMIADQFAINTKVSEIQNMLQELIGTGIFNKLENTAIKYISSTILNLLKALTVVNDELKIINIRSGSIFTETYETEKELSLKMIQDLSQQNEILQQKLQEAEENYEQLIQFKGITDRQEHTPLPVSTAIIKDDDMEDSMDNILYKEFESMVDEFKIKDKKALGKKWFSKLSHTAPDDMTPDVTAQHLVPEERQKRASRISEEITEDKMPLKTDDVSQKDGAGRYQPQQRKYTKSPHVEETSGSKLREDVGEDIGLEAKPNQYSTLHVPEKKRKEIKLSSEIKSKSATESKSQHFLPTETKSRDGKSRTSGMQEKPRKLKTKSLVDKSSVLLEDTESIDKQRKSESDSLSESLSMTQVKHTSMPLKAETEGKTQQTSSRTTISKEGKTKGKETLTKSKLDKSHSRTAKVTPETIQDLGASESKSERSHVEAFQKAIMNFLKEKINNIQKPSDRSTMLKEEEEEGEKEELLETAEIEQLGIIKGKIEEYFKNVTEIVTNILRKYQVSKKEEQVEEKPTKEKKEASFKPALHYQKSSITTAQSEISTFLSNEGVDPTITNLIQVVLTEMESGRDATALPIAAKDHEKEKQKQEQYLEEDQEKIYEEATLHKKDSKQIHKTWRKKKELSQKEEESQGQEQQKQGQEEELWAEHHKQRILRQTEQEEQHRETGKEKERKAKQQEEAGKQTTKEGGVLLERENEEAMSQAPKAARHPEPKMRGKREKQKPSGRVESLERQREKMKEKESEERFRMEAQTPAMLDESQLRQGNNFYRILELLRGTTHSIPSGSPTSTQSSPYAALPIYPEPLPTYQTLTPQQAQDLMTILAPQQVQDLTTPLIPQQIQALGTTLTPAQVQALRNILSSPRAEALGPTLTPQQVQGLTTPLIPQQIQALGTTLTPAQVQALRNILSSPRAEALGPTLTPQQVQGLTTPLIPQQIQALGTTLTPAQVQALRNILSSPRAEALGPTLTPQQVQGLTTPLIPQQIQALGTTLTPAQVQALRNILSSPRAEALGPILTPQQVQALGTTLAPQEAQELGTTLTPEQVQELGTIPSLPQAEALEPSLTPQQVQALMTTPTPAQVQALGTIPSPPWAEALGTTPTPQQSQALTTTLIPQQAQAPVITLTPAQFQVLGTTLTTQQAQTLTTTLAPQEVQDQAPVTTLTPAQVQALGSFLTPQQAEALGTTLTPQQVQDLTTTMIPQQVQALGTTLTPAQVQALGTILSPPRAEALGTTLSPQQSQALTTILSPQQSQALGTTLSPQQSQALGTTLTPAQVQALGTILSPPRAEALGTTLSPQQSQALGTTLSPQQSQALTTTLSPQQSQALTTILTPQQSQALGTTLSPQQSQALGTTLSPQQSQALRTTLTPAQVQALGTILSPPWAEALGTTLSPQQSQALTTTLSPQQSQALTTILTPQQSQALTTILTPQQSQALGTTLSPQQSQALGTTLSPQQSQALGTTLSPQQSQALRTTLTPAQVQALGTILSPPWAEALGTTLSPQQSQALGTTLSPQQSQALGTTLTPQHSQAPVTSLSPAQVQALGGTLITQQAQALGTLFSPQQSQTLMTTLMLQQPQAQGTPQTPQQIQVLGTTLTLQQAEALGTTLTPLQAEVLEPTLTPQQAQALGTAGAEVLKHTLTPKQAQALETILTPEQARVLRNTLMSQQAEALGTALTPQHAQTQGIPLTPEMYQRSDMAPTHEQARALQAPLSLEPARTPGVPGAPRYAQTLKTAGTLQIQARQIQLTVKPTQLFGVPGTQEQAELAQAIGATITPELAQATEVPLTFTQGQSSGVSLIPGAPPTPGQPLELEALSYRQLFLSKHPLAPQAPRRSLKSELPPFSGKIPSHWAPLPSWQSLAPGAPPTPEELLESGPLAFSGKPQAFLPSVSAVKSPSLQATPALGQSLAPSAFPGQASPPHIPPPSGHLPTLWTPSVAGKPQKAESSFDRKKRLTSVSFVKSQSSLVQHSIPDFEAIQAPFTAKKIQISEVSVTSEETFQSYITSDRAPVSHTSYIEEEALTPQKPRTTLPPLTTRLLKPSQLPALQRRLRTRLPSIDKPWIKTSALGTKETKMMVPPSSPQEPEKMTYFVDVEAQRKNLILLNQAIKTSAAPSQLHVIARNLVIETLHMDAIRLGFLFHKYIAYRLIQRARNNIIRRVKAIQNTGRGYETKNLYVMLSRIDDYQKKVMRIWTEKQKLLEERRNQCLRKMIPVFSQLREMYKLNLSQPIPLITDKKQIPVSTKYVQQPIQQLPVEEDRLSDKKIKQQEDQLKAIWNADLSTSSYPIIEKTPVSLLWAQLGGFPDIPRLLQLDIQSTYRKSLASLKTRCPPIGSYGLFPDTSIVFSILGWLCKQMKPIMY